MWHIVAIAAFGVLSLSVIALLIESARQRRLIRTFIACIESLSKDGTALPLPDMRSAPKEVQLLAKVVTDFASRVDTAHARDVEVSRVKSDFISTAAHQLRTPLTGIRWALEALQKEQLTEDQRVLVASAVEKSHDLVAIVGTLLDISSIESGKYKYTFTPTNIVTLAHDVVKDFLPMASSTQVSLFYEGESDHIPPVRADHDRIKWVLNNLIENAVKYSLPGGTVRLSAETLGGKVYLRVKDGGIGIPEKERGNIFERFYRAGNAISKENKGSGLGLYIARTIATDHGGDLNFQANENGPGTTFTLSLPVA